MADTLVYAIATGRCGTAYLAELLRVNLPDAQVHHEHATPMGLGHRSPDASHFTRFNTIGNVPEIQAFWRRKLAQDAGESESYYAESSHFPARAGLIENLDLIPSDKRIVIISLRRNPLKVAWSYHCRHQFVNNGYTWLFALDPGYPNVILNPEPFRAQGAVGVCIWYVIEMHVRAEYYKRLLADEARVTFCDVWLEDIVQEEGARALLGQVMGDIPEEVDIPPQANASKYRPYSDADRVNFERTFNRYKWDSAALAEQFIATGRRLAHPPWVTYDSKPPQSKTSEG